MRYFVHRDGQILGPYAPADLAQAGGLHEGTLVCEEAAGGREGDWRSLSEVAELAGLPLNASTALLEGGLASVEPGELERLELDALGAFAEEPAGAWAAELIEEAGFRKRWEEALEPDVPQSLQEAQSRIQDLNAQLAALKARLLAMEAHQGQLLASSQAAPGAGVPMSSAAPELPALKLRREPIAAPPAEPSAPPEAAPAPEPTFKISPPKTFRPRIQFGPSGVFKTVSKPVVPEDTAPAPPSPANAAVTPPPVAPFEWSGPQVQAQTPPAALPQAKTAQALPTIEPASSPQLPPAAVPGEAKTLPPPPKDAGPVQALPTLSAPAPFLAPSAAATPAPAATAAQPVLMPPQTTPVLQPPPLPQPATGAATAASLFSSLPLPTPPLSAPATAVFSGPAASAAALTPSRSNLEPAATPVPTPATQEVLARLAKPPEQPPTEIPKPRRGSKLFVVVGFAIVLAVTVVGYLFLGNSRDLKMMVSMEPEQPPAPAEEAPAAPPAPPAAAETSAAVPGAGPAIPIGPAPAPAPPPQAVPDPGQEAITLVKNYPLDGERGTVERWLQFSYTADPGAGNREEWSAGAVDATTYLVEYKVLPGPGSAVKETISLLFEADTARGTVLGKNPRARELLAGGAPVSPKPARPAGKRVARKPKPAKPKEVPLLPLPADSELLPPGEDDSQFRQDIVEGGL